MFFSVACSFLSYILSTLALSVVMWGRNKCVNAFAIFMFSVQFNRPLSLYVLFSHFRPRDATRGNSFFQMSSYARAIVCITNDKNRSLRGHVLTGNECYTINIVYVIVDMLL